MKNTVRNILLIDDEENNLELMTRCLKNDLFKITKCLNPIDALEKIKENNFDIILSDHKMPEMNGIELLEKVDSISPDSIKILITAYSDADILINSINRAKVFRYIKKPYSPNEIKAIIESAIDYIELKESNKNLVSALKDLFSGTIKAIVEALDAKDSFTLGRSRRVTYYSIKIAEKMGLSNFLIGELELAGLLHDIGMIGVNDDILYKTDRLTKTEYEEIKLHVNHGIKILEDIDQLSGVIEIIKHHHEHYDGTGYPDGLKGEEIPLLSRIIAITDAYDSMISNRVYRQSLSPKEALSIMLQLAGKQFDPNIMQIFIKILPEAINDIKKMEVKKDAS